MTRDVIIVGGGVIGCSIALALAREGLKVSLIERDRVGCEASSAAAGMLLPHVEAAGPGALFDLSMRSRAMYPAFARQLHEISGIDPEYRDEGTLVVQLENDAAGHIDSWAAWQIAAGLEVEPLSGSAIGAMEPALTKSVTCGVFVPGDHQVENRRLMQALAASTVAVGVELIEGEEVRALIVEREKVTGVSSAGGRLDAAAVVVAAGCWSGGLLETAGLKVKTIPARGQMIALRGQSSPIRHVLHAAGCYLAPRRDGRVVIGSTVEYVGFQKGVTAAKIASLLSAAVELVPALADFEVVETWSGLRPDTIDHLPVLGRGGIDNLYLATGHFRNGILLAPVTADLIAELIVTGRPAAETSSFGVERFDSAMSAS